MKPGPYDWDDEPRQRMADGWVAFMITLVLLLATLEYIFLYRCG